MNEITKESGSAKFARILAIIIFSMVLTALLTAIISDFVIFATQIFTFIFACFASVIVFLFAIILMVISCMLIFGIYLLKQDGFWPESWARNIFSEILADKMPTKEQVMTMSIIRIVLIVVCIAIFILSIICLAMNKKAIKNGVAVKIKRTKAFGIISLILSLLGTFVGLGTLFVLSLL